jgi:hypothetical protein
VPTLKELESWLSTGQVARELGISRQGAINLAESRKVRAAKTACGWLYDPQSVRAALKQHNGEFPIHETHHQKPHR